MGKAKSPYRGLEGKGNYPSESVKNYSNKSKAKLKRKKCKKIPRDQLPLTKRDRLLLETLDTFGLLSTQQIENHIFNKIDKSTCKVCFLMSNKD